MRIGDVEPGTTRVTTIRTQAAQMVPLTRQEVEAQAIQQAPKGMTLTYIVEEKKGEWKAYYAPKKGEEGKQEEPQTTRSLKLSGRIFQSLDYVFNIPSITSMPYGTLPQTLLSARIAPSIAELNKAMMEDKGGAAEPVTTEQVFWGAVAVASITAPLIQRKFWQTPQQKYYASMKKMSKQLYGETALEKTRLSKSEGFFTFSDREGLQWVQKFNVEAGIKTSANAEMWLNVQQPYETLRTQPREQFYRLTQGTPQTPMSKTLAKLNLGGLTSEEWLVSDLVTPSNWAMPPALRGLSMMPKIEPVTRIFPSFINLSGFRPTQRTRSLKIPGFKQMQTQALEQSQRQMQIVSQVQRQVQQQIQRTEQAIRSLTPNVPRTVSTSVTRLPWMPQFKPSKLKGLDRGLYGKWFRKRQLIKTPKEMMRTFFGSPPKRRRKR